MTNREMDGVIMEKFNNIEKSHKKIEENQQKTTDEVSKININLATLTTGLEINNENFSKSIKENTIRSKKNEKVIYMASGGMAIIVFILGLLKTFKII